MKGEAFPETKMYRGVCLHLPGPSKEKTVVSSRKSNSVPSLILRLTGMKWDKKNRAYQSLSVLLLLSDPLSFSHIAFR
jgi:hypothetical protein